jgi:hypothetical protein
MTMVTRNFVPAKRSVQLGVKLTETQYREVRAHLLADYPSLQSMALASQLQTVNAAGKLIVSAVRGGILPSEVDTEAVRAIVDCVVAASAGDNGQYAPLWADAQAVAFGRRR